MPFTTLIGGVGGVLVSSPSFFFRGGMNKLSELISGDIRKLPTDILRQLQFISQQELSKRRHAAGNDSRALASAFHGLPHPNFVINSHVAPYYAELLKQDWSGMFDGSDEERFYVYAHIKPGGKRLKLAHKDFGISLPGLPFYIGKGCGQRAYDLKRNQGHGAILKELESQGVRPKEIVHILFDGLAEAKALELESKLIYLMGTKYEQGRKGLLVNLEIPPRPEFVRYDHWQKANRNLSAQDDRAVQSCQN